MVSNHNYCSPEHALIPLNGLNMLLYSTEMNVQFMEVLQKGSKGCALSHLGKGVDILGEALATITKLAIRTRYIGVGVVDIARQQYTCMHLAPVGTHLLAVLAAGIEVSNLISSKHVVHVLGQLCFQRGHDGELLANEDPGE